MSEDERNEIYYALQAAYGAYEALSDKQMEEITGAEIFESLFDVFNGMVNLLEANVVSIADGPVTITDSCRDCCSGHIITGASTANTITVESGTHNTPWRM